MLPNPETWSGNKQNGFYNFNCLRLAKLANSFCLLQDQVSWFEKITKPIFSNTRPSAGYIVS